MLIPEEKDTLTVKFSWHLPRIRKITVSDVNNYTLKISADDEYPQLTY